MVNKISINYKLFLMLGLICVFMMFFMIEVWFNFEIVILVVLVVVKVIWFFLVCFFVCGL